MRTFRVALWREFERRDPEHKYLKDENGEYFRGATDRALMYPMLEMAGYERTAFIMEFIYTYRRWGLNLDITHPGIQAPAAKAVKGMPPWDLYRG